jgi:hypothetical protein
MGPETAVTDPGWQAWAVGKTLNGENRGLAFPAGRMPQTGLLQVARGALSGRCRRGVVSTSDSAGRIQVVVATPSWSEGVVKGVRGEPRMPLEVEPALALDSGGAASGGGCRAGRCVVRARRAVVPGSWRGDA